MNPLLDTVRTAADSAMLSLIWLVQLIIYPAFYYIESGRFMEWHRKYVTAIGLLVIPLMLIQAGCIGLQLVQQADAAHLLAAAAVAAAWIITFAISAPCHRRLQQAGHDANIIRRLIATNWLRTACWSLTWMLGLLSRQ